MPSAPTTTAPPSTPASRARTRAERIAATEAAFRALIAVHRWLPDLRGCSAGCRYWPCDPLCAAAGAHDAAKAGR